MNILLNLIILLLLIAFGLFRLTKDNPDKRSSLLNVLKNAPKNFYLNCKIIANKIKNKG
jgi:uncharacterized protein YxeA